MNEAHVSTLELRIALHPRMFLFTLRRSLFKTIPAVWASALIIGSLSGQTSLVAHARKQPVVPAKTYFDPVGGITFQYPAVWTLGPFDLYLGSAILSGEQPATASVSFRRGDSYKHTGLGGLAFIYQHVVNVNQTECDKAATGDGNLSESEMIVVNGKSMRHRATGDAGMCHTAKQNVFWTYRKESCFLFETDFETLCTDKGSGDRALTATETRMLNRHLQEIVQSIKFSEN